MRNTGVLHSLEEPSRHPVGGKRFKLVFEPKVRVEVRVRAEVRIRARVRVRVRLRVRVSCLGLCVRVMC